MLHYKKALYVFPSSSKKTVALKRLVELVAASCGEITFLKNLKKKDYDIKRFLHKTDRSVLKSQIYQETEQAIHKAIGASYQKQIKHKIKIITGDGQVEVVKEIVKGHYELTAVEFEPLGIGKDKDVLSSKNLWLLRNSPCPILVVRQEYKKKINHIVVTIDPESNSVTQQLNAKLMAHAITLAKFYAAELHILQCWHLYGESALKDGFIRTSQQELKEMLMDCRQEHEDALNKFLAKFDLSEVNYKIVLKKGDITEVAPKYVHTKHINLVVMGTVGRSGLKGLLIGNSAETILRRVKCSVLAMKPDEVVKGLLKRYG